MTSTMGTFATQRLSADGHTEKPREGGADLRAFARNSVADASQRLPGSVAYQSKPSASQLSADGRKTEAWPRLHDLGADFRLGKSGRHGCSSPSGPAEHVSL